MSTDQVTTSWVTTQGEVFRARRHFLRDIMFDKVVRGLLWNMTITGLEHIPAAGPVILMINHSATPDPVAALGATRPRFVVPMSKVENLHHPFFSIFARNWGAYTIRRGEVDRQALKITLELLKAGEMVLIAPEGTRKPALIRPKGGLAYLATRADLAPVIVPTAIYDISTWARDLLIPWRRTPVKVTYGRGFRLKTGGQRRLPRETLEQMMDEVMYQLAVLLPDDMRGVYADESQATTDYLDFV